ncbi:hypothetical protein JNB_17628 [Janibacter sp. HTCC2649]|uniref:hypothetical protein n=1 Tax=Janibacter sp. HTCC2649 TaxID=313589 RepID=UPI0000670FE4|nr:hypothetical protein [Janibacter sp. HTCC2649]EAP97314.1 hypothetical protein JNB_17628 [Janibacter sp. HTCC2649]
MSQHDDTKPDETRTIPQGSDETTTLETLLDESQPERSTAQTSSAQTSNAQTSNAQTSTADTSTPAPAHASPYTASYGTQTLQTAVPEYKSSPAPTTSVFGLLGLLTAIAVLISKSTDLDIPWGVVGPVAVVGAGVLLVVLGLAGLRGQRFRG